MKIEINNVQEAIRILDFIIQNGTRYNPYTTYKILAQKESIIALHTASEWASLGASVNECATPVVVPLPVSEINIQSGEKIINALKLSDKEKKLLITEELQCEETIFYCDFTMFDMFDTDFPPSEMDGLFTDFNFMDISKEQILIILSLYLTKFGISTLEKPLEKYGLEPFADIKNNILYVEEKAPEVILDVFISFLCEKTSSQSNDIQQLENLLTIYIIRHALSFSITSSQHTKLEAQLEHCMDEDMKLNLSDSITRAFAMSNFIINALKEEYEQMMIGEEQKEKVFETSKRYSKSAFNNIKESN